MISSLISAKFLPINCLLIILVLKLHIAYFYPLAVLKCWVYLGIRAFSQRKAFPCCSAWLNFPYQVILSDAGFQSPYFPFCLKNIEFCLSQRSCFLFGTECSFSVPRVLEQTHFTESFLVFPSKLPFPLTIAPNW